MIGDYTIWIQWENFIFNDLYSLSQTHNKLIFVVRLISSLRGKVCNSNSQVLSVKKNFWLQKDNSGKITIILAWGIQLEFLLNRVLAVQWCIMYNWTSMVWVGNNRKCPQWTFVLTLWSYRIEANLEEAGHLRQYFKILPSPWPFLCLLLGCHGVNCDLYHALLSTCGWNLLKQRNKTNDQTL